MNPEPRVPSPASRIMIVAGERSGDVYGAGLATGSPGAIAGLGNLRVRW